MIRHVYLIQLKDRAMAGEVAEKLRTLQDNVPSVERVEVGIDFRGAGNSYDLMQMCEFKNRSDFEAFCTDAYHEQIRRYMATVTKASWKVDYEV